MKTVMAVQMILEGDPLIRLCASHQSKNATYKGEGREYMSGASGFCFVFSLINKLLCKKLSRVILTGFHWTQLCRSPLKTILAMSCLFKQEMDAKKGPSEQACYQKPDSGGSKR